MIVYGASFERLPVSIKNIVPYSTAVSDSVANAVSSMHLLIFLLVSLSSLVLCDDNNNGSLAATNENIAELKRIALFLVHTVNVMDMWMSSKNGQESTNGSTPLYDDFAHYATGGVVSSVQIIKDLGHILVKNHPGPRNCSAPPPYNFFCDYRSYEEIQKFIQDLATKNSQQITFIKVGTSSEGRDFNAVRISTNSSLKKPVLWIQAGQHGTEEIGPAVASYLALQLAGLLAKKDEYFSIVDTFDWYILPMVNPDGYVYGQTVDRFWRKTRKFYPNEKNCTGVDPNRNWDIKWADQAGSSTDPCSPSYAGPNAFSEVEIRSVSQYMANNLTGPVKLFIDFHNFAQKWMSPFGYTTDLPPNYKEQNRVSDIAVAAIKEVHNYTYLTGSTANILYTVSGGARDWAYVVMNATYSYTVELRDTGPYGSTLPPVQILPNCEEMWAGIKATGLELVKVVKADGQNSTEERNSSIGQNSNTSSLIVPYGEQEVNKQLSFELIQTINVLDMWLNTKYGVEPANTSTDLTVHFADYVKPGGNNPTQLIADLGHILNKDNPGPGSCSQWPPYDFFCSYKSYEQVETFIKNLVYKAPTQVTPIKVGTSYEGRDFNAVRITTNKSIKKPVMWIQAGQHATEQIGPAVASYIALKLTELSAKKDINFDIVDTFDWYILPVVNPDGYVYAQTVDRFWRKTRKVYPDQTNCTGVDPNRNWDVKWADQAGSSKDPCSPAYAGPNAFSENETRSVSQYMMNNLTGPLELFIDFHNYGQMWMSPFGYTTYLPPNYKEQHRVSDIVVAAIKEVHNSTYVTGSSANVLYTVSGGARDWAYEVMNATYSYTVELRDAGTFGFILPRTQILPTCEEIWAGIKAMGEELIKVVKGSSQNSSNS